jgi:uncharacterized protein YkwD
MHRMGWGHRLVSRLGFGTGAVVATVLIAGVYAVVTGHVSMGTIPGSNASDRTVTAVGAASGAADATSNAGIVGNETPTSGTPSESAAPAGATPMASLPASSATPAARSPGPATRPGGSRPAVTTTTPVLASTASTTDLAEQVLAQLNQARSAAGLPALVMSDGLVKSATAHNNVMAGGCGLAHQCQGEPDLGKRITGHGIAWTAAGENIGQGGPEPDQGDAIVAMAKQLTADMLAETAPNDGHKKNILSKNFRHVGINLYRDANGTVWMTQDFAS